jgi:hypothetical protein
MRKKLTFLTLFLLSFTAFSQVDKTIVIEHYTNTRCGICANKNPGFYNLIANYPEVLHIAYHPSSPYPTCIFNQHNPSENDARANYYGVYGGTPRVVLSGSVIPVASQLLTNTQLEARLDEESNYMAAVNLQHGQGDTIVASIVVRKVSLSGQENLNLYAVLAEREIMYNAPTGENTHHDVFRKVLADETITIDNVGDSVMLIKKYLPHPDWQADEMFVLVMVQDELSKEILQSAKSDIAGNIMTTGFQKVEELKAIVFPNPVQQQLNFFENAKRYYIRAKLYDSYGRKLLDTDPGYSIDMRDFPKGLYILVLTDKENRSFTAKVQKN